MTVPPPPSESGGLGLRSISTGTHALMATTEHFVDDWCVGIERDLLSHNDDGVEDPAAYPDDDDYKAQLRHRKHSLLFDYGTEDEDTCYSSLASSTRNSSKKSLETARTEEASTTSSASSSLLPSPPPVVVGISNEHAAEDIELDLIEAAAPFEDIQEEPKNPAKKNRPTPRALEELDRVLSHTTSNVKITVEDSLEDPEKSTRSDARESAPETNEPSATTTTPTEEVVPPEDIPTPNTTIEVGLAADTHRSRSRTGKRMVKAILGSLAMTTATVASIRKKATAATEEISERSTARREVDEADDVSLPPSDASEQTDDDGSSSQESSCSEGCESAVEATVAAPPLDKKTSLATSAKTTIRRSRKVLAQRLRKTAASTKLLCVHHKARLTRMLRAAAAHRHGGTVDTSPTDRDRARRAIEAVLRQRRATELWVQSLEQHHHHLSDDYDLMDEDSIVRSVASFVSEHSDSLLAHEPAGVRSISMGVGVDTTMEHSLAETMTSCFTTDDPGKGIGLDKSHTSNGSSISTTSSSSSSSSSRLDGSSRNNIEVMMAPEDTLSARKTTLLSTIWRKSRTVVSKSMTISSCKKPKKTKRMTNGRQYELQEFDEA